MYCYAQAMPVLDFMLPRQSYITRDFMLLYAIGRDEAVVGWQRRGSRHWRPQQSGRMPCSPLSVQVSNRTQARVLFFGEILLFFSFSLVYGKRNFGNFLHFLF